MLRLKNLIIELIESCENGGIVGSFKLWMEDSSCSEPEPVFILTETMFCGEYDFFRLTV